MFQIQKHDGVRAYNNPHRHHLAYLIGGLGSPLSAMFSKRVPWYTPPGFILRPKEVPVRRVFRVLVLSGCLGFLAAPIFLQRALSSPQSSPSRDEFSLQVSGHIYRADTNQPVRNAVVSLSGMVAGQPFAEPPTTLTDASGAYRFDDLGPGYYTLLVDGGPYFASTHSPGIDLRQAPLADPVDVKLEPTGILSGTVTTASGSPVPGLFVQVMQNAASNQPPESVPVMTDDLGAFQITGIHAGNRQLAVTVDQGGPPIAYYPAAESLSSAGTVAVKAGIETTGIQIKLPEKAATDPTTQNPEPISGRVLRSDNGAPIPGAIVTLRFIGQPALGKRPPSLYAIADADGAYRFPSVGAGNYQIGAKASGFVPMSSIPVQRVSSESAPLSGVETRLQAAGVIAGTVTGTAGEPLWLMSVVAFRRDGVRDTQAGFALTDFLGNFRVSLPAPGEYYLKVGMPPFGSQAQLSYATRYYPNEGSEDAAQPIEVQPGFTVPNTQFTLPAIPTFTLAVRIQSQQTDRSVIYFFNIQKGDSIQRPVPQTPPLSVNRFVFASAGSKVSFRNVPNGTYTVSIDRADVARDSSGRIIRATSLGAPLATANAQVNGADVMVEIPLP